MAKKDKGGNLVTAPLPLKKLYLETYKERLSHRPMKAEYSDIFDLKTKLWKLRYEELKSVKSLTLTHLRKAIKGLLFGVFWGLSITTVWLYRAVIKICWICGVIFPRS